MKTKVIIGLVVIVVFTGFAVYSFSSSLNPYVTFREAAERTGTVQVLGYLSDGVIDYDLENEQLRFYMQDDEGTKALVTYEGAKPNNIEHAESLVVVGEFNGELFQAQRLLVKCPSKYEDEMGKEQQ